MLQLTKIYVGCSKNKPSTTLKRWYLNIRLVVKNGRTCLMVQLIVCIHNRSLIKAGNYSWFRLPGMIFRTQIEITTITNDWCKVQIFKLWLVAEDINGRERENVSIKVILFLYDREILRILNFGDGECYGAK